MELSVIIPVYKVDDHLDICLLSTLGQSAMQHIEPVCVPIGSEAINGIERVEAWRQRDSRVRVTEPVSTLYDALRIGIISSCGRYVMFMNQTDIITSADNLLQAIALADQLDVEVLLTASEQRTDTNALAPSKQYLPNDQVLPQSADHRCYSVDDAGINIFILTAPVVYGNIYRRQHMAEMFQYPHVFANVGDLAVSQIALLHAHRVSHTSIPTIRSRYEACVRPYINGQELRMTEDILVRQIAVKLATGNAPMVVQNILLYYLAHLLSSYHPYSSFRQAVEHYMPLCQYLNDPIRNDFTPHLKGCIRYISSIVSSATDTDSLIEAYTMPARGLLELKGDEGVKSNS